uniref:Uncharacterized protein n=1 Tax=Nelumbo nucifera TaxID=4432 RepID=A0A822XS24_NELNU|nr:TPA_asm: hypothetical protein HUJ06_024255 [Nelumbo nucifera]
MHCRPLGFLIGLPFALIAFVLSVVGGLLFVIGSVLTCFCPWCYCYAGMANFVVHLIQLPIEVIRWFIGRIPC